MKKFLTLILLVSVFMANAQDYNSLIAKADAFYKAQDYRQSFELFEQALKQHSKIPNHLYNGACSAALAGKKDHAFQWLDLSVEHGWSDIEHLKSDSDLNSLHGDNRWKSLINKLQENVDKMEASFDKPLKKELEMIFDLDQNIRTQYIEARKTLGFEHKTVDSLGREMNRIDSLNQIKIVKILDTKGWVGRDLVGPKANQTLFLVIQHADLEVQKKYLPMMREAVEKKNANPSALALLEDRIALREGRKQIYGSQVGNHPDTKQPYVLPLMDPDTVDERRASVGLGSLSDYLKNWDLEWDVETYKKLLPEYEAIAKKK